MLVVMIVVGSETSIRPPAMASPQQRGAVDLSRTCIQAVAVTLYLALLCALKPFVHSRLRRWKLWVTASNQGTTLLLILTRLLAEQARATRGGRVAAVVVMEEEWAGGVRAGFNESTASDSGGEGPFGVTEGAEGRPAIFTASLVFMYISTGCCLLQFVVLGGSFLWSLFEGAKVEQVIIVAEVQEQEARAEASRRGELHPFEGRRQSNDDTEDEDARNNVELVMMSNPCRGSVDLSRSSRGGSSAIAPESSSESKGGDRNADVGSLSFATKPMSRLSKRRSTKHSNSEGAMRPVSMGDGGEAAAAAGAAGAVGAAEATEWAAHEAKVERHRAEAAEAAEAAQVALEEEERRKAAWAVYEADAERHRVEAEEWAAYEAEEERHKAEWAAHEAEVERHRAEAAEAARVALEEEERRKAEWVAHKAEVERRRAEAEARAASEAQEPQGGNPDDNDNLATARSRLRSVLMEKSNDDGGKGGEASMYEGLVSDTRGDWVEVCDDDGAILGESLTGKTVYFNKTTFETRLTKPPGWVRMQAREISKSTRRSTTFTK